MSLISTCTQSLHKNYDLQNNYYLLNLLGLKDYIIKTPKINVSFLAFPQQAKSWFVHDLASFIL